MKQFTAALLAVTLVATAAFGADAPYKETKDKIGYGIGLSMGKDFKERGVEVGTDALLQGLKDGLSNAQPKLTEAEIQEAFTSVQKELAQKQMAEAAAKGAKNKKAGEDFLAANKKKAGVITTKSGLQYKVITEGKGATPTATSKVKAHYRGTLIDGTEFDSSYKRGEPVEFEVAGVIKGWTEALQLMKVGSKWQLFIPSELAYGEEGGGPIGPNSTLIFDVELLAVTK